MLFPEEMRRRNFRMARTQDRKLQGKPESLQVRKSPEMFYEKQKKTVRISGPVRASGLCKGRVSASSSGSLTIETALALPFVLFFFLPFFSLFSMLRVQMQVQRAMERVLDEFTERAIWQTESVQTAGALGEWYLCSRLQREFRSIPEAVSVCFDGTGVDWTEAVAEVQVKYEMEAAAIFFPVPRMTFGQHSIRKLWIGIESPETGAGSEEDRVYVTESGQVYHRSRDCTYLRLSIRKISWDELETARNQSGERYDPCGQCHPEGGLAQVYITDSGDHYHADLSCSGLKRTVYEIPSAEAEGLSPCSRCGTRED